MGVLDSLWEGVEDFGSTVTSGLEDIWDTIDQVYVDDFLGGIGGGVTSFSEHLYHDVVDTDPYRQAATAAMMYWGGGGKGFGGEANSLWGPEGAPAWIDSLKKISNMTGGQGGTQSTGAPATGMRSGNYSDLIGRLNNIITQQIDPYEEIVTPTGARY